YPEALFPHKQPAGSVENVAVSNPIAHEEPTLPKTAKPHFQKPAPAALPKVAPLPLPSAPAPSLFDASDKIVNDTLLRIREDLGDGTPGRLNKHRHPTVFGDGHPKPKLVFVAEVPGADEKPQGLPLVGRAGKLL